LQSPYSLGMGAQIVSLPSKDPGHVEKLIDEAEVLGRVEELAEEIAAAIEGDITLIGVLKGTFVFLADLARALDRAGKPVQIEFLRLSSYGNGKQSLGDVLLLGGGPAIGDNREVVLVDDIVDTGHSVQYAQRLLQANGIETVWTCTLLNKPSKREVEVEIDFVGFEVPDVFVVGYGIDYAEKYRSLPYIGAVQ